MVTFSASYISASSMSSNMSSISSVSNICILLLFLESENMEAALESEHELS